MGGSLPTFPGERNNRSWSPQPAGCPEVAVTRGGLCGPPWGPAQRHQCEQEANFQSQTPIFSVNSPAFHFTSSLLLGTSRHRV